MSEGVVYVAFGENAEAAMGESLATLRKVHPDISTFVIDEDTFDGDPGFGARWAKLHVDKLTPFDKTLYLDADTLIHQRINRGFEILDDWDLVLTASINQGADSLRHLGEEERLYTQRELGEAFPLQLQLGVFYFDRYACRDLFRSWREEWRRYRGQDQGAFLRALYENPVKYWLLGRPYNSIDRETAIVEHLFGRSV